MCGTLIEKGKCSCGTWFNEENDPNQILKKALEHFHEMKRFTLTADMPHLGCAVVYFRGDYNDCDAVERFIRSRKGRPNYDQ